MNELELKYGCNPNQKPARIFMRDASLMTNCLRPSSGTWNGPWGSGSSTGPG